MKTDVQQIISYVQSLNISDTDKEELLAQIKGLEKDAIRADFRVKRTLKDKSIVINLLNTTIEDLQKQQSYVERSNKKLSKQKKQIERKNEELEGQKIVVEEQANMLEKNLSELERSYSELEQFSYIASHDLKSPLRTIASYAQLLKRRYLGRIDEDADEFINFIVKGANHMDEIICDLLEYSRSGREKEFVETDLNNTLEVVKFNLRDEIIQNKAIIETVQLPKLVVNKSGIIQLFQNLVGNAIKFRRDNQIPAVCIESHKNGTHWHFKVSDNGVGMDEAYQEKAFLPFQRINNLDRPGTGMGLAICKKIVKMHKGEIWYNANEGPGTTFYFTIAQTGLM